MRQLLGIKPMMAGAAAEGFDDHKKVFQKLSSGTKYIGRATFGARTLVRHSVSLITDF
jgi:3-hydroxyisobutyrate dehydrogenase-like beta-hydroxyacid dehydrogenase